jgi:hypothetical protein
VRVEVGEGGSGGGGDEGGDEKEKGERNGNEKRNRAMELELGWSILPAFAPSGAPATTPPGPGAVRSWPLSSHPTVRHY